MPDLPIIWVALGANIAGAWGEPVDTLDATLGVLQRHGCDIVARSGWFHSLAIGPARQPRYINGVVGLRCGLSPAALLRLLKRVERAAGRRSGTSVRWGPRPLDCDIVDFGGRVIGWPASRTRPGSLILPHPSAATRGFVLVPLQKVAPHWRHPVLGVGVSALLSRDARLRRGVLPLAA